MTDTTKTTAAKILPLPELTEAITNWKKTVDRKGNGINPRSAETCYMAYNSLSLIFSALVRAAENLQKLNQDQVVNHLTSDLEEVWELTTAIDLEKLATDIYYAGSYQAALSLIQADAQGISALTAAHLQLLATQTQHGVAKQKLREAKFTPVKFVVLVKTFDEAPGEKPDEDYYHRRENINLFSLGKRFSIDLPREGGGYWVACKGLAVPLSERDINKYFQVVEDHIFPSAQVGN